MYLELELNLSVANHLAQAPSTAKACTRHNCVFLGCKVLAPLCHRHYLGVVPEVQDSYYVYVYKCLQLCPCVASFFRLRSNESTSRRLDHTMRGAPKGSDARLG